MPRHFRKHTERTHQEMYVPWYLEYTTAKSYDDIITVMCFCYTEKIIILYFVLVFMIDGLLYELLYPWSKYTAVYSKYIFTMFKFVILVYLLTVFVTTPWHRETMLFKLILCTIYIIFVMLDTDFGSSQNSLTFTVLNCSRKFRKF